jgi:hypothetical protein
MGMLSRALVAKEWLCEENAPNLGIFVRCHRLAPIVGNPIAHLIQGPYAVGQPEHFPREVHRHLLKACEESPTDDVVIGGMELENLLQPVQDRPGDYVHSVVRTSLLRSKEAMTTRVRCAIYTRKSSEEGLEQSFNSLDAQREACEAYVLSQRHEGWHPASTRYDDGGFSGGNMERQG